jgi:phosphoglucosamine mutase
VVAGLASAGVDVVRLGVIPTPGVAHLVGQRDADLGVMLSASHNPMPDNGIKFFARGGLKLDDELEDAIEQRMNEPWDRPVGADVGRVTADPGIAEELYIAHLVQTLPDAVAGPGLAGLRIAVDCANGAASGVGPTALRAAGADVVVINASPDGRNINDNCGSTHMEPLQAAVVAARADLGVAFDGDADRCLAVDATGEIVDGDQIMGILAIALRDRGELAHDTLVLTVMSNLGLTLAMTAAGIATVQTSVGDRYVLEAMRNGSFGLGGEQSGHLVIARHATTGDGVLTALQLSARMAETGRSLADLAAGVAKLPQVLVNVAGVDRARADSDPGVQEAVAAASAMLGATGRVLLRPSGTEPVVRVMVEASDADDAERVAKELAEVVRDRLAL